MRGSIEGLVRPSVFALAPYASARDEFTGDASVYLDANESPFGPYNRYPDPYQTSLKQRLSQLKDVDLSQIFVGNGSDEVIDLVFRVFCRPSRDRVIVCPPTYGMYRVSAAINEVNVISVPLRDDFQLDMACLAEFYADHSVKVIFVCSPNNPTGNTMQVSDILTLLDSFEGIVVVDEAYIDFSQQASLVSLISSHTNLIVCQTFSKAWGLAAARVGTAYADPGIIDLFSKVKPPYNVSTINQEAICTAIDQGNITAQVEQIIKERQYLKEALQSLPCVRKVYDSQANFLLTEVDNADKIYSYLSKQGIVIRNRSREVANCVRITVGCRDENVTLIESLKRMS